MSIVTSASLQLLLAIWSSSLSSSSANPWTHLNQLDWALNFPSCGDSKQSPIDLPDICSTGSPIIIDRGQKVEFYSYGFDLPEDRLDLVNTGHTLSLKLRHSEESANDGSPGVLYKGAFYQFSELHFHWNENDTAGSEHTINGSSYAAELHMVHYNTKYKRLANAVWKPDGLLVLGIFLKHDREVNDAIQPILDMVGDVITPGRPTFLRSPINLLNILPGRTDSFYTYSGSLTTPPCAEPVTWVLFVEKGKIAFEQLADLQKLSGGQDLHRDIQPINQRKIYASSDDHCYPNNAGAAGANGGASPTESGQSVS